MKPHLSINLAVSADGKISDPWGGKSGWTSREDHQRLLALRQGADALLVGRRTLLADSMTMTVPNQSRQPLRCIVSRTGQIPGDHPIHRTEGGPIHLLCTESPPPAGSSRGIKAHHSTLERFLEVLAGDFGIRRIHCEGGGWLIGELARHDAIDTIHLTLAGHTLFGGGKAPTASGIPGVHHLVRSSCFELNHWEIHPTGEECFLTYARRSARQ